MRAVFPAAPAASVFALLLVTVPALSQEPDPFRWMSLHADPQRPEPQVSDPQSSALQNSDPHHSDAAQHADRDHDIVFWVERSLSAEKWSAIREIGVEYDAALVVTTTRSAPDAMPSSDSFQVWSVSLTNHGLTPLLKGYNLRWIDWMRFAEGAQQEPAVFYDSCVECAPDTYFTAFHYDRAQHMWAGRFLRGDRGAPVASANPPAGVTWTQAYAGLAEPSGRELLGTWSHFDYGGQKPAEDFIYRYDLDSLSGLERTQLLSGKDAEAMKQRICRGGDTLPLLAHGQDSALCQALVNPHPERKPVTTPPTHNRGQSSVPRAH